MNLALRRGLFFPTAEIYPNAPAGFFDYGPEGVKIRRKIMDFWRKEFVEKEGFLEIHGAQILPESVFKASGHLDNFNDPVIQCRKCHAFFRADKLLEEKTGQNVPEAASTEDLDKLVAEHKLVCGKCKGPLDKVKKFNMMMKVMIGASNDVTCYLRPETCQNIFLDFLRVYKLSRRTLPLGLSQVGSSYRNEIAPRQQLLRERELGQMETEVFFNPLKIDEVENWDEVKGYKLNLLRLGKQVEAISCQRAVDEKMVSGKLVAYYLARVQQLYEKFGIPNAKLRFRELDDETQAFYAKETWDFATETDLGWIELIACNYRTDYDLKRHGEVSKVDLAIKEEGDKEAFIPHVFEVSIGLDRTFYVLLDLGFRKEKRGPEERVLVDLNPKLAPSFVAVFPLQKKDGLYEKAWSVHELLLDHGLESFFDEKGSIGKRYARVDEIGVPYAVTVDYDSLKDESVTLRERNTMAQSRVKISDLHDLLWRKWRGKE